VTTPEQFQALISSPEGSRVEFKAAESGYEFEKLARYCVGFRPQGPRLARAMMGGSDGPVGHGISLSGSRVGWRDTLPTRNPEAASRSLGAPERIAT